MAAEAVVAVAEVAVVEGVVAVVEGEAEAVAEEAAAAAGRAGDWFDGDDAVRSARSWPIALLGRPIVQAVSSPVGPALAWMYAAPAAPRPQ